jgi:hypothetical protein
VFPLVVQKRSFNLANLYSMPDYSASIDTTKFAQAVKFVFENSAKAIPDIVNRGALVAIIGGRGVQGAMQRTMKASAARIREVDPSIIAAFVRKKHKGQKHTKAEWNRLVKREYARRVAAIGYTANVGWNNAAMAFGGRGIGRRSTGKGYASSGYGKPAIATTGAVTAEFANTAPAATLIGQAPLQDALNDTARDMIQHMEEKIGGIFRSQSAK